MQINISFECSFAELPALINRAAEIFGSSDTGNLTDPSTGVRRSPSPTGEAFTPAAQAYPGGLTPPEAFTSTPVTSVAPPPMPAPAPAPPVQMALPVTAPPTYSVQALQQAAGSWMGSSKERRGCLLALLQKYQVPGINQLPPDKFGAFATDLRALGVNI